MKKFLKQLKNLIFYKKALCLSLAFVLFFNLSAQAFLPSLVVSEEISASIKEDLEKAVAPTLSPKEFLSDLNETLNKAITESDKDTSSNNSNEAIPAKKTKEVFTSEYKEAVYKQYKKHIQEVNEEAQKALEEFDKIAAEEIERQTANLLNQPSEKATENDLFAQPSPFQSSSFQTSDIALAKVKKDLKNRTEDKKEEKESSIVNLTPKAPNPLAIDTKIKLNLDPELTANKTYEEYKMSQEAKAIKQKQSTERSQRIANAIAELKTAIEKQRGLYTQEVADWKNQALIKLDEEQKKVLNDVSYHYKQYSEAYDKEEAALRKQEVAYYKDLVHKAVENFKKTDLKDIESQRNFINIITILSSIKEKRLNRHQFIVGEDKQFIRNYLYGKFSEKNMGACQGTNITTYEDNVDYGSCTSLAAGGGSVSAARMFECQSNKKVEFKLSSEDDCNLALSAMLPYANIDGDGYAFTNFIRNYWDAPMFGQILPMVVKSALLTNYRGEEALSKFITDAISKENTKRNSNNGFWETMNLFTLEGFSNNFMHDGKYCEHNLCASADTGYDSPNAWEEVAHMLADANKTNILKKVTAECKIVTDEKNNGQNLKCGGIYPLLFGTLLYKPELANSLQGKRPFVETPGQTMNQYGHIEMITQEKANNNKKLNDKQDLLKRYGKAELMMAYLIYQNFEDVHPANKMRMINEVSKVKLLNPKGRIKGYDKNSDIYKKSLNKYNIKQVVWGVTSYADILIAIVATKDLVKIIGLGILKIRNVVTFMKVLRNFKNVPLSFTKSVKIANALKAKGIGIEYIKKVNKLRQFAKAPVKVTKSTVIARLGEESQALIGSVSGRIIGVKNGVLVGTQEVLRPVSKAYNSSSTFRQTPLGGIYSTHANNLPIAEQRAKAVLEPAAKRLSFRETLSAAWAWINPYIKADKGNINLNTENITLQIFDKKGNPVTIEKITVEDGVLYINGEMFKTFKACLPEEQLDIINQLVAKHNIELGIKGLYVKPRWKDYKPSFFEKFKSKNTVSEMVDVYDETGKVIMQIGLDRAHAPDAALLERLGIKELPRKVFKATGNLTENTHKAKLVYFDNALYIEEGVNLAKLENLEGFSIPKTAIFNATRAKQDAFLTELFSMPGKASSNKPPLKFSITRDKVMPIYLTNILSYSAASSGLLLTLEQEPFNFTPGQSLLVGLALPYITSFVTPIFAPLVSKFGARRFLNYSLGTAALGLGIAVASGYYGQSTYQTDKKGRVLMDSEGNKLFKTKDQLLPTWPLYITSSLTGIASSGVRASSNVILKGYEVSKATLTKSMLFKNIGGLSFTLIPFLANSFAGGIHNEKLGIDIEGTGKFKDFSFTYPIILGATLATMGIIRLRMPKLAVPGYRLRYAKADFSRPWKLLTNPKIWPYVGGMILASSLEGYVLFKGVSTFAREMLHDPHHTPDYKDDNFLERENAKFLAALVTAVPQLALRWWSPRKAFYGRGLFNSALLATVGTGLLLLPSDDKSIAANAALGVASALMVGFGTANAFQYSQKLIISQADLLTTIPNARRDAQILYSMSNLGLAMPFFFGMDATRRKEKFGESEVDATRHTFHWPLICYALGMGMIAGAERNLFTKIPGFTSSLVKNIGSVSNNLFVKPTKYFINPILMPAVKYTIGGATLTKPLRQDSFESVNLPPLTTPKLNLNFNPMPDNMLNYNTTLPSANLQTTKQPLPVITEREAGQKDEVSKN